mgnify:CR=1 FL=1|jgi:flagellar hook assembly protein FlgD
MKKIAIFIIFIIAFNFLKAQTEGTLTFNVTTASTGGYSPKHIMAIWIEKADGTFIKTRLKRGGSTYINYLNVWLNKSGGNATDAVTSATINTHQQESITWDGKDLNGNLLPDGDYKVWVQMAWANSNGPTFNATFTKGPNFFSANPTGTTNYLNISLNWQPNTTSINKIENINFSVYPNPFKENTVVKLSKLRSSETNISVYDNNGKLVKVIFKGNLDKGNYNFVWNSEDNSGNLVSKGIYYINIFDGKNYKTTKIIKL